MRSAATLIAVAATVASVTGQTLQNYTSSLDMTIDPNSVPIQLRATWCQGQSNTCRLLCDNEVQDNDCEQTTLEYECNCSNGSAPGLQYYSQTMPTFICETLFGQCINQYAGDADGQSACTEQIDSLCGEQEPPTPSDEDEETSTASTSTTAPSTTSGAADSTATEDSATSTTESDSFAAPTLLPGNGVAAVAAIGILAALV